MASTVAAQTRDFARRFFQVVLELGGQDWVAASDAFERTITAHADHPYVAYLQANRARRAGFPAAAERVREQEFPQIERRKAGTRRNAPVFYRIGRADAAFSLDLPYEVPSSHPLRVARGAAKGSPLRRDPEPAAARSPWRRRLSRRRTSENASSAKPRWSAGWWQKLADGAAGLLDTITRTASKRQR
jgi:type II secretory pathway component PulJ